MHLGLTTRHFVLFSSDENAISPVHLFAKRYVLVLKRGVFYLYVSILYRKGMLWCYFPTPLDSELDFHKKYVLG